MIVKFAVSEKNNTTRTKLLKALTCIVAIAEISMGSNIYLSLINVYTGPGPGRVSSADTCHVSGSEADLAMISDTQVGLFDV